MTAFVTALRWDVVLQARNGFYWASAFVVLVIGGLLLAVPEAARANGAVWVPAIVAVNLQITTFFFMAGLMLLERDEGTLSALAVSPLTPGAYLATRVVTLTALAAVETIVLVLIAFDAGQFVAARPLRHVSAWCDLHRHWRGSGDEVRVNQYAVAASLGGGRVAARAAARARGTRAAQSLSSPSCRTDPHLDASGLRVCDPWRTRLWRCRLPHLERCGLSVGPESREPVDA